MFTGIVTELGVVGRVAPERSGLRLRIRAPRTARGLRRGGSVAVDGVCLTAVDVEEDAFTVQVIPETLGRTTLEGASRGRRVNLERPLRAGDEIGGHFVQGHVDATARLAGVRRTGGEAVVAVQLPRSLTGLVVQKGSIAVNGVSLTVASVGRDRFTVALIPHTLGQTNLGALRAGDRVNLEADVLGKYVRSMGGGGGR